VRWGPIANSPNTHDGWVREVLEVARGHLAWAMADMTRRNRSNFPGFANPDDTLQPMMPYGALEGLPKKPTGISFGPTSANTVSVSQGQRGDAMKADVLAPDWDFFEVAERDLEELRWQYGIQPLMPAHAAAGVEIILPDTADPYAN
jgi:hypothetical protein